MPARCPTGESRGTSLISEGKIATRRWYRPNASWLSLADRRRSRFSGFPLPVMIPLPFVPSLRNARTMTGCSRDNDYSRHSA